MAFLLTQKQQEEKAGCALVVFWGLLYWISLTEGWKTSFRVGMSLKQLVNTRWAKLSANPKICLTRYMALDKNTDSQHMVIWQAVA